MKKSLLFVIAVIALFSLTACAAAIAKSRVVTQASFDHDCPEEKVTIVSENTDIWAYKLDVCGKPRKYRDLGNSQEWQFVDVTDGASAPALAE